jgi:hypothetical protein
MRVSAYHDTVMELPIVGFGADQLRRFVEEMMQVLVLVPSQKRNLLLEDTAWEVVSEPLRNPTSRHA